MKTKEINNWRRLTFWFLLAIALDIAFYYQHLISWLVIPLIISLCMAIFYAVRCLRLLFTKVPFMRIVAIILFIVLFYLFRAGGLMYGLIVIYIIIYLRKRSLGNTVSLIIRKEGVEWVWERYLKNNNKP